ncbi:TonB-dependent receptor plug domain-containing protein [Orbaceae bacterium ESL0727]|nr:TonB-dependent receptor plug domain-containing protein [Orbaceae bacterium ESL0727]
MKKTVLLILTTPAVMVAAFTPAYAEPLADKTLKSLPTKVSHCAMADSASAKADDGNRVCQPQKPVTVADIIVVKAPIPTPVNGNTYYDEVDIERLPTRNGNVSDLLKTNPAVRFNDSQNSALNQGSIDPQNMSFHGASPYQNLFLIDGVNATNTLDPANTNMTDNGVNIPGNSQGYYLDISLLDKVRVYDSNVPVEYGQFNGGVVDAQLRRFSREDKVKLGFRTTRDSWASTHVNDKDKSAFESGGNGSTKVYSPNYRKYFYTVSTDKQLADNLGFTTGISHRESTVKRRSGLDNLNDTSNNTDDINTVLSKFTWFATNEATHDFTLKYNRANHEIQTPNFIHSGRDMGGEAYGLAWQYEQYINQNKLTTHIGWDHMENYTNADATKLVTERPCLTSPGIAACTVGGQGHISQAMDAITSKARWDMKTVTLGQTTHNVYFGGDFSHVYAQTQRHNESESYMITNRPPRPTTITNHYKYRKGKGSVDNNHYALYLADTIAISRLSLTPGVRYDYDNFLDNHNIAPRLRAELDLFGNHNTILTSGYNRYYGTSFYSMKLQADRSKWKYNALTGAQNGLITTHYNQLDTPYSDEWTLGVQQKIVGMMVGLNYVNRRDRDQFNLSNKTVAGMNTRMYNNKGKSDTDSYNASIKPIVPYQVAAIEIMPQVVLSYMDTKGNLSLESGYDDTEATNYRQVVYNGKLMDYEDVPGRDYNTPWVLSMNLDFSAPDTGVTWANTFKYQSKQDSRVIVNRFDSHYDPSLADYKQFRDISLKSNVVWDTRLSWQPTFIKDKPLVVSMDILNILNKKNTIPYNAKAGMTSGAGNISAFGPGRELWLQTDYTF